MNVARVMVFVILFAFLIATQAWVALASVFGSMALLFLLTTWPEEIRELGIFLAALAFVGTFMALQYSEARLGFYAATAQIIPVLFLGLAVGSRFSLVGIEDVDRRTRIIVILGFIGAETYSLAALATRHPASDALGIVSGALVAAGVALVSDIIGRPKDSQNE